MKRIRKLLRLQPRDLRLLIITLLTLNAIRLGLYLLPFKTVYQQSMKIAPFLFKTRQKQIAIARLAWAVEAVSRVPYPPKCLARALTMQILLRWQAHPSQVQIGVAKNQAGRLEAHAWVESSGKVVMGGISNLAQYTPLPTVEDQIVRSVQ